MADEIKKIHPTPEETAKRAGMTVIDVAKWSTSIRLAKAGRLEWLKKANSAKNYRLGRRQYELTSEDGEATRAQLQVNLLQLRYLGRVASQVAREPTFHCFGTRQMDGRSGSAGYRLQVNEGYLKYTWRKQRLKKVMRAVVADGVDYARGVVMVDVIKQTEMIPVPGAKMPEKEDRHPGPGEQDLIRHEHALVADTVVTFRVDTRRLLFDQAFSPMDSPWLAISFRRTREEVMKGQWLNPHVAEIASAKAAENLEDDSTMSDEDRNAIAARGNVFDLLDVWDKTTGRRMTYIDGSVELGPLHVQPWLRGLEKRVSIPIVDDLGTPVGQKYVVSERRYPIELYQPRADNDEPFTRPDAQDLIGLQTGVTELRRLQYDHSVSELPRLFVDEGEVSQDDIDKLLANPNKRCIKLQNPNAAKWVEPPKSGSALDMAARSFKEVFDEMATMPAMSRGMPTDHQISATEASITEAGQKAITDLDQDELEDLMCRVAELQLKVASANLRKPFTFAVHVGRSIRPFQITGKDLDPDCIIQVERNGTRHYDREFMEQKTIGRINAYVTAFTPFGIAPMEVRRLKEIMLDEFGWGDEGVLTPVPEQYQGFLAKVIEMLTNGLAPDQIIDQFNQHGAQADDDLQEAEDTAMLRDMRDQHRDVKTALQLVEDTVPKPTSGEGK